MSEMPTCILVAGVLAMMLSGCSYLVTRAGTDPQFFRQLEMRKGNYELIASSPTVFVREMTERGASCFEAKTGSRTARVVCGYATCSNDSSFVSMWDFNVISDRFSALKSRSGGSCKRKKPDDLKRIQQDSVRQEIFTSGQQVF